MQTIGHMLKKTRESKSLTVDQVNKKTRIHADVLVALEEGSCDQILSYTYVKSFLKKYCDFLGLNPAEILQGYPVARQEKMSDRPVHPKPVEVNRTEPVSPDKKPVVAVSRQEVEAARRDQAYGLRPETIVKFIYVATSVILAVLLIFAVGFIGKKIAGAFNKKKPKIVYTIKNKSAAPKKKAAAKPAPAPQKTAAAVKDETSKEAAAKSAPITVSIKTKRSVLVKVKNDGVLIMERVLPKGAHESFKAQEKIDLYVARAEAVEVSLNGNLLASPGKGIKNLEITRKGMRAR
jgi:cytoskeletal protein RodZ